MNTKQNDQSKTRRRSLRQNSTKPETLVWTVLRNRKLEGLKFRRQHSIEPYIADFVCSELKLVIEVDGGYHDDVYLADQQRQTYLESKGYRVIRFSNADVLEDVESVAIAIRKVVLGLRA